ncbi:hypothetical protein [Clostridium estertheticum]|uniref:hypothetical protein n=1 Tax=Clostridium estertheticum TaxID=238834 RepID=UPI001C0D80EB|nr:hypothetical protein [Clostridium estertheticum]MBU3187210.1 hypothetical protein [Clostridium estertheticum]
MIENRKFNRMETETGIENFYIPNFGYDSCQEYKYTGYIKCKLVHKANLSIIMPDQIYLEYDELLWIQPLNIFPNQVFKEDGLITALLSIDISCGNTIKIEFTDKDFIRNYEDGANLFKCKIYGPKDFNKFATGTGYMTEEYIPVLNLYHHTTEESKQCIINCGYFWPSPWNIQGNKSLVNVGYAYLTCLDKIKTDNDLREIAMASDATKDFVTDKVDIPIPTLITDEWKKKYKNEILELKVLRQSIDERQSTLSLNVDATILSTQHILMHTFKDIPVYYEIMSPFIYRIGVVPQSNIYFDKLTINRQNNNIKQLYYIICGDATTMEGLIAPFDEENTSSIFKIERVSDKSNILEFWFDNCNMDHYTNKTIEVQIFNKDKSL